MELPHPGFRQRVRDLAEREWREPVSVVFLYEVKPLVEVPGRRKDGTVAGKRLVRRFFWNILRGTVGGAISVVLSVAGGGRANFFERDGRVTGPANARAMELIDRARDARCPWLVYSDTHVGVVECGGTYRQPTDSDQPVFLWQDTGLRHDPVRRRITWPDVSSYGYHVSPEEIAYLRQPDAR